MLQGLKHRPSAVPAAQTGRVFLIPLTSSRRREKQNLVIPKAISGFGGKETDCSLRLQSLTVLPISFTSWFCFLRNGRAYTEVGGGTPMRTLLGWTPVRSFVPSAGHLNFLNRRGSRHPSSCTRQGVTLPLISAGLPFCK